MQETDTSLKAPKSVTRSGNSKKDNKTDTVANWYNKDKQYTDN